MPRKKKKKEKQKEEEAKKKETYNFKSGVRAALIIVSANRRYFDV